MTTNDDDAYRASPVNRATADAAATAKEGIDVLGDGADRARAAASNKLNDASNRVAPTLEQGIDRARSRVDDQAGRMRDGIQVGRDKVDDLTAQVLDYTRDEPVKALLVAAAVGAALVGLLGLIARSDD